MSDPILNSLKEYWESLRAGRLAPYRSEIHPRPFEHALENMFILEIIGKETVRVRLAGMKLCEMTGVRTTAGERCTMRGREVLLLLFLGASAGFSRART